MRRCATNRERTHAPLTHRLARALASCTTTYAYRFDVVDHGSGSAADGFEDDAIKANLKLAADAVELDVTNKTSDVLQVEWNKIVLDRGDGTTTRLRPASDIGWVQPGNTAVAQLVPVAFPASGSAAAQYDGRKLELAVPMLVNREAKTYRFSVLVHTQPR